MVTGQVRSDRDQPREPTAASPGEHHHPGTLLTATCDELADATGACEFPVVVWDGEDGVIVLANELAEELLATPSEELVGRRIHEILSPVEDVATTVAALASGAVDSVRSKRSLHTPRGEVPVWVWSRAVELEDHEGGVSLVVPRMEITRLGRDPSVPWRNLVPIAVGLCDDHWRIVSVSSDVHDILGATSHEYIGRRLVELMHPADAERFLAPDVDRTSAVRHRSGLRFKHADGNWVKVCVFSAPCAKRPHSIAFALVGSSPTAARPSTDRLSELELRLRRIGAEVRAAGLIDEGTVPAMSDVPELRELTTRQWEILSRLLRGARVPTISSELFLSPSTVRNHLATIFRRFGVHSQAELLERLRESADVRGEASR